MPPKRKAAGMLHFASFGTCSDCSAFQAKKTASSTITKKAKTASDTMKNASKAVAKQPSASAHLKAADSGLPSDNDASDVVEVAAAPSTSGAPCRTCGKPGLVQKNSQAKISSVANEGNPDFTGRFAWFNSYADELASVRPEKNPTAAQWAAVYSSHQQARLQPFAQGLLHAEARLPWSFSVSARTDRKAEEHGRQCLGVARRRDCWRIRW